MIEINNIVKYYPQQKVPALNNVSFKIETGEFFGLLGPNGAGKSTLIKVLSTLLMADEGEILVDGEVLKRNSNEIKRKLAMITQEYSLRSTMTPDQIMMLQGKLYGIPKDVIKKRSEELLGFCGLLEHRNKVCRNLSGGMKRKLMLCRGLLTDPEIIILDEPTVGLDPFSRRQMWDLLKQLNADGKTVLLTTHYIDEAQYLCEKVALIDQGVIDTIATPKELINELGAISVDTFKDGKTTTISFNEKKDALDYVANMEEDDFMIRNTTLEDVFLERIGKILGGAK